MIKGKAGMVMVFGVFDRLHPGHRYFLRQAKKYGRELIVVVARDSAVEKLKNKKPWQDENKRLWAIRKIKGVTHAVLGDRKQGSYDVVKRYRPDVICLGYDQYWLKTDLKKKITKRGFIKIRLVNLASYRPNKFHTSLLQ